jgi:hypothetical protein
LVWSWLVASNEGITLFYFCPHFLVCLSASSVLRQSFTSWHRLSWNLLGAQAFLQFTILLPHLPLPSARITGVHHHTQLLIFYSFWHFSHISGSLQLLLVQLRTIFLQNCKCPPPSYYSGLKQHEDHFFRKTLSYFLVTAALPLLYPLLLIVLPQSIFFTPLINTYILFYIRWHICLPTPKCKPLEKKTVLVSFMFNRVEKWVNWVN